MEPEQDARGDRLRGPLSPTSMGIWASWKSSNNGQGATLAVQRAYEQWPHDAAQ